VTYQDITKDLLARRDNTDWAEYDVNGNTLHVRFGPRAVAVSSRQMRGVQVISWIFLEQEVVQGMVLEHHCKILGLT
jgi:hypothetical protein